MSQQHQPPAGGIDREAEHLLDRVGLLMRPCGLDLLCFFARHPRSLLSSESLASFLGYDAKELAESLETLITARILERSQTSTPGARLYVLASDSPPGDGWLLSLIALASTREGRLALRRVLSHRPRTRAGGATTHTADAAAKPGPRRVEPTIRREAL